MALLFMEGFEINQAKNYFDRYYAATAFVTGPTFVTGRKRGTSLADRSLSFTSKQIRATEASVIYFQWAIRKEDANATTAGIIQLNNAGGEQFNLLQIASSEAGMLQYQLRRGSTVLATTKPFNFGTQSAWHAFQLKVTIHPTTGTYELRHWDWYNNMEVVAGPATNQNTSSQGSGGVDRFVFSSAVATGGAVRVDDIVVWDDSAGELADFTTDPILVYGILPSADGNQNDWTASGGGSHASLVDDAPNSPDQTDHVHKDDPTGNPTELYDYAAITSEMDDAAVVYGIQVNSEMAMLNSGTRTVTVRVRSGVSEASGDNLVVSGIAKVGYRDIMEQNPIGPADWTKASIDAAEFGVRLES